MSRLAKQRGIGRQETNGCESQEDSSGQQRHLARLPGQRTLNFPFRSKSATAKPQGLSHVRYGFGSIRRPGANSGCSGEKASPASFGPGTSFLRRIPTSRSDSEDTVSEWCLLPLPLPEILFPAFRKIILPASRSRSPRTIRLRSAEEPRPGTGTRPPKDRDRRSGP